MTPEQVYERFGLRVQGEPLAGTETLSQAEQIEYQRAVAKGLPMDTESRMQRAREMGYDTGTVWYHGSKEDIKPGFTNRPFGVGKDWAIFFSENPKHAGAYGEITYPVYLNIKNPYHPKTADEAIQPDVDALRAQGYDGVVFDADGMGGAGRTQIRAVFDPSQIRSVNAAFDPDFAESGNLLAQGPLPAAMDQYRSEQEARPIKDAIKEPLRNKDEEYRKNAQGDITGAPEDVKSDAHVQAIVDQNMDHIEDPLAQMPSSAEWYEVSGAAIRSVTHGDPELTERLIRIMAVLSAANQVGANTTGAVKAIYQIARGEAAKAGRFPNDFAKAIPHILKAHDLSLDTPKIEAKVMSFYRNLWDATFLSNKYENAATMDMWMARLYGYRTDTFGPAQYRFANMVTQMITDQYNAKHETSLKPRQIQAALWVYARNRERYGEVIGASIALEDRSAFDTYIERAKQHITVEAVPSVDSGLFPEIHLATPEQRTEYTRRAIQLILNENGENELFRRVGIPLYQMRPSEGTFEGVVNPNEIMSVVSDKRIIQGGKLTRVTGLKEGKRPRKAFVGPGKPSKVRTEIPGPTRKIIVETKHADLAAQTLQYIYTQDGVPWMQLDPTATGANQGVAVYMSAQPTIEMEEAFLAHLSKTVEADFTRIGNDLFLLNFNKYHKANNPDGITDQAFKQKVVAAINSYTDQNGPGAELMEEWVDNVKARSNYHAADWKNGAETVATLERQIRDAGGQDLLRWARDRREAVARLQADFRDENLAELYQGPNVAPFDLAFDHILVAPEQLREWEDAHAADRAAEFMQESIEGKREFRRPPSVRKDADGNYTVIDGRSGTTAAIRMGYGQIPVRVIDDVRDAETGQVVPVTKAVDDFYKKAGRMKDKFDKAMEAIAQDFNGVWKDTPLKGRARAMYKVDHDYKGDPNRIKDILRGTIAVNKVEDIEPALERVVGEYVPADKVKTSILNALRPNMAGYKDVNVVIDFNGVKAEVQINTREMLVAKHFGHDLYGSYREIAEKDELTDQEAAMVRDIVEIETKLYRDALALADKMQGEATPAQALAVVHARIADVEKVNDQYGLSINFRKSDLDKVLPLWMADPMGKFRGGSESHALQVLKDLSTTTGTPSTSSRVESLGISKSVISSIFTSKESIAETEAYAQPNRGAISFAEDGALISLLENADLSTFLHESGHFFFEMYKEFAADSPEIAQDLQVLLDYIGVPDPHTWDAMTLDQRRQGHERVARAFEAYLFEGNAPSLEMQSLFDKFRSWLLDVYKQLRGLNVTLTDDVREVFDRMLASEEQIRSRQVANGYAPIFGSQEEGAMTAKQWQDYQEKQDRAAASAVSALEQRSLRDMQWLDNAKSRRIREMQAAHKALRAETKKQVTQELENTPVYQAIRFVSKGELVDVDGNVVELTEHQLDRAEFKERYFNFNMPRGWTKEGGLPMDDVAQQLGWRSGPEMVDAMLSAAPLKEQIERVTDQRMLEEHGELPDMAAMNAAADEAVRSDAHTRFLNTELNHLRKGTGITRVSHQAAKAYAETAIARRKARNIKSYEYARAEARAGRNAMRALQRGDRQEAAEHKRAQVISNHFYRAARKAEQDIERITKYLRKFDKPGTRKNLDREYLDQIDAIIEKVGLKKISQKEVDRRKSFAEWYESKIANNEQVEVPKDYLERLKTHFSEMAYEELSGLRDNVKNIEHLARLKEKLRIQGELRDYNETMDEAYQIALKRNPQKHDPEDRAPKKFQRVRGMFSKFRAHHVKPEFLSEQLDGDVANGVWWNVLFRPVADAENAENEMLEAASVQLGQILSSDTFKDLGKKIFINNKAGYYDKNQIISMALNWGNEGNREALVRGLESQQVAAEDIQRILDENLTAQDWQTVQAVWDYIDSYWPMIAELQKRLTGVVPEKVERAPIDTPFGEIKGGYYPLIYDTRYSERAFTRDQKMSVQEMLATNFIRPSTKKGHTMERVGSAGQAVKLDISVISQHVTNVIHDLAYREAVLQVDRVIQDSRTRDAIERIAGQEYYRMLRPWLANVANANRMLIDPIEAAAGYMRKNATIVNMGFKLTTAILQPLGYSQSFEVLGEKWAMHGLAQFYGNPFKAKALQEEIFGKSTFMRNRMKSFDRDINDAIKKIKKEHGPLEGFQQWAFQHIGFMDMLVTLPTWKAGYDKSLSEGMSESDAIAQADKMVRMSQAAGGAKDLAIIQQGSEYKRLFTMFYSYFSSMYNLMRRRRNISGREPVTMAKVARNSMAFMYLVAVPALLSEIIVGRGPDEDEDEDWYTWTAKIALSYPLMSVVGVRDVTNAAVTGFGYEVTPVAEGVESIVKAAAALEKIATGDAEEKEAKKLLLAGGYLFGLPSRQLWTIIDNTMAMAEGDDLTLTEQLMIREQRER
jgi:hypothetical protein